MDYSSGPTDYVPADCSPTQGPFSGNCTKIFVSTWEDVCRDSIASTCTAAAESYTADAAGIGGFPWGTVLSIFADVIVSGGLALQKVAHNRIEAQKKALGLEERSSMQLTVHQQSSSDVKGAGKGEPEPSFTKMPVWWAGIIMTIGGEVCNFVAYGDPNTPASVVTAVGCIGVIANAIIATSFLGEVFRKQDAVGIAFVLIGVILVVVFAPQQQKVLTEDLMIEYFSAPWTIVYLVVLALSILALFFLCPRFGHRHVLWNLSMASLIGSVTVMSSKCVSTFAIQTIEGIFVGPALDQVDLSSVGKNESQKCFDDGHTWSVLNYGTATSPAAYEYGCILVEPSWDVMNDTNGDVIQRGLSQHDNPFLYVSLILMIATAIAQVKYINLGMSMFDNSEVIPTHYVTFTLFSIVGTSIAYQEFQIQYEGVCRIDIYLHFFLDGCVATFVGVWLITSGRSTEAKGEGEGEDALDGDMEMTDLGPEKSGFASSAYDCTSASSDRPSAVHAANNPATDLVGMRLGDGAQPPPPPGRSLAKQNTDKITALPDLPKFGVRSFEPSLEPSPSPRAATDERARRPSLAESFGLPDGGVDSRMRRSSRAASVTTFLGVLGGGHSAAFLFDPTDKKDYKSELDIARSMSMAHANEKYALTQSMTRSMARSISMSTSGPPGQGPPKSLSVEEADPAADPEAGQSLPVRAESAPRTPSVDLTPSEEGGVASSSEQVDARGVSSASAFESCSEFSSAPRIHHSANL